MRPTSVVENIVVTSSPPSASPAAAAGAAAAAAPDGRVSTPSSVLSWVGLGLGLE